MGRTFLRLAKWVGTGVLLSIITLSVGLYLYLHRGPRPWIKTSFPEISDWNSLKVIFSRGPCLGTCPIYTVSIDGRGNVQFKGLVRTGNNSPYGDREDRTYRSKISEAAVHELFAAFQKAQFYWLYHTYAYGATDLPENRVSISFDGQTREVIDYWGRAVGMPKEVTELENTIDRVAHTNQWLTPVPSQPSRLLLL